MLSESVKQLLPAQAAKHLTLIPAPVMKNPLLPRSLPSRLVLLLISAVALTFSTQAAYIAGLDGVSLSSSLEAGQTAPLTTLPNHVWIDIAGTARFFDLGPDYDGRIIHETDPYGNHTEQYRPLTEVYDKSHTLYTLTFHIGYTAGDAISPDPLAIQWVQVSSLDDPNTSA